MTRPLVYMAHPYGGNAENLERAKRWLHFLHERRPDWSVHAPWIASCQVVPETPENRAKALIDCERVARRFDRVVLVGGQITDGMRRESANRPTDDLTWLGPEPPQLSRNGGAPGPQARRKVRT